MPLRQKMVTWYFQHFCMVCSLFSQILSTSVKYVELQARVNYGSQWQLLSLSRAC